MINTALFEALEREKRLTEMYLYIDDMPESLFLGEMKERVIHKILLTRTRERIFIQSNINSWLQKEPVTE
jgi:hypothetical protein